MYILRISWFFNIFGGGGRWGHQVVLSLSKFWWFNHCLYCSILLKQTNVPACKWYPRPRAPSPPLDEHSGTRGGDGVLRHNGTCSPSSETALACCRRQRWSYSVHPRMILCRVARHRTPVLRLGCGLFDSRASLYPFPRNINGTSLYVLVRATVVHRRYFLCVIYGMPLMHLFTISL